MIKFTTKASQLVRSPLIFRKGSSFSSSLSILKMIFSLLIVSFVASCMGQEIIQELWVTGVGAAAEALEISKSTAADVQHGLGMLQEQQPIVAPTSGTCGPSICDITCTSSQFCSHTGAVCFIAPCCPAYECKNKQPSTTPSPQTQDVVSSKLTSSRTSKHLNKPLILLISRMRYNDEDLRGNYPSKDGS